MERPNQVWASNITYLPMRRGFLYFVTIMDWFTCRVLSWRISNTLKAGFCVEALNEAIHKFGPPGIMYTDQGRAVHLVCMDGPTSADGRAYLDGRLLDNIFVELLWRTLECEWVDLYAREAGSQTRTSIRKWIDFYNRSARITPLATNCLPWSIGSALKNTNPISRRTE
ncbi:DDE-type integrase/transposase/recombinase [Labrenzia sp. CE80]|uniref:DDE-type integrase/transposase/recombinase n=1 Tax=Labrenzia sp. CE80 TaxID=1788986 RepID=UPI00129B9EFD|nr:DDE-type integrase/transposase/recombinase [Labrenzia sp. CE80]